MKAIKKEIKQSSLIHQKIRTAAFVPSESQDTEKFKYNLGFRVSKYINKRLIALKTTCNKIIQKPQLWMHGIYFIAMIKDVSLWSLEALVEGFVINFIMWALLGWDFTLITMLAWGFVIKQLLSIYWRLRKKDGSISAISKENK